MALVVLLASGISLTTVVLGMLAVPLQGSLALFLAGTRFTCSPPRRWASSWAHWRGRCRSSATEPLLFAVAE
ncbi:hypothetical protein V7x_43310 [Crateriforma conspicua]|uniref:Uncharacterized protein n=1 Tax=Crateriforma conspicua TaxID=2527996 RepID=A0A5C6FQ34_9PLAN|nr:hypothetical protein V7x_43310 [Crateriforma conspicua]